MPITHPSFGNLADDRIIFFDTTLRDGEQSPGFSMNLDEKLRMADALHELGVDVIEAGFAIASPGDFDSVQSIARRFAKDGPVVASLSRANPADIMASANAVKPAARPRIHIVLATSELHMRVKLRMTPEEVLERITDSVTLARNHAEDVEWSAEDGSRSDDDFLCRCVEAAIRAGATTINIPDTVGYALPEETARQFTMLRRRVPNADQVIFSTHNHNDLGLAVANTLAAVQAGVRQIECTINGIGERAGNAALEEIVMAIRTRNDIFRYECGVEAKLLTRASKLVATVTSFPVQYNKAIVGRNAFAHESGIHQDGMLKNTQTYEIMTPASVGVKATSLVMGKHSGRNAFKDKLKHLGYTLSDNQLEDAFVRFKDLADRKKVVYDEDIEALVDEKLANSHDRMKVMSLLVVAGTMGPQAATLTLDLDGVHRTVQATGNGPVDAVFNAIKAIVPHEASLELYQVHAVTAGTDAQAEVSVRLEADGQTFTGKGADPDTLVSSAKAYLSALNKVIGKQERLHPQRAIEAAE